MGNTIIILTLSGLLGVVCIVLMHMQWITVKKLRQSEQMSFYYDDEAPPRFFITGDKHREFTSVKEFCRAANTRCKDVLIILGDSGFNYYKDIRDDKLKAEMSALNITLFCIHGNKECRPEHIGSYGVRTFRGGKVYYEPKYPNIYFAIDGEVYTFEGRKYIVVGGAHSVDKQYCLEENKPYWEDEMPDDAIKAGMEGKLAAENNTIYGIMTHTCPIKYLPTEMFMSTRQKTERKRNRKKSNPEKQFQANIDRSTEEWLGEIEEKADYTVWFCGHYHIDKQIDKVYMMHREIRPLHGNVCGDAYE